MRSDDPEEVRLHELFSEFREQVFDVVEDFSARVMDQIDEEVARGAPTALDLLSSVLVEVVNLVWGLSGGRDDEEG